MSLLNRPPGVSAMKSPSLPRISKTTLPPLTSKVFSPRLSFGPASVLVCVIVRLPLVPCPSGVGPPVLARTSLRSSLTSASRHHQHIVADDPHGIGADAPLRLDGRCSGGELEPPLVPGAIDEFEVANHDGISRHVLVD